MTKERNLQLRSSNVYCWRAMDAASYQGFTSR